jgi:prepilin-type N-terminal cleavage/methylation domain-containing protein
MRGTRRGFTLIEITVALVMFSVVAMVLTRMLIMNQRITTAQSTRAALQSNLRVGSLVVPNELRMLNQSDSTDIAAVSDTSISYRAMRGYYLMCALTSATSIKVINVQPSGFTFGYREPKIGDSAFVFFENDTLKMSDDKWAPVEITGVAPSTCVFPSGGTTYAAYTLTFGGAGGGINTTNFPIAKFVNGAPVRTFELTTLTLYDVGGVKWFGMCTGPLGCTPEPVLGPLASTNGITITRYNDVGTVVTGNTFADRNSLRSLRIRFIGVAEQAISRGGDGRALIQDTLTTVVTLRNVKQN